MINKPTGGKATGGRKYQQIFQPPKILELNLFKPNMLGPPIMFLPEYLLGTGGAPLKFLLVFA